jgi:hypothetical protein
MHAAMKKFKQRARPNFLGTLQRQVARALKDEDLPALVSYNETILSLMCDAQDRRSRKEADYLLGLNVTLGRKIRALSRRVTLAALIYAFIRKKAQRRRVRQ